MPRTKKKKGGWQPGDPVDGSKRLMSVTKAAAPCKAVEYAVNTVKDLQQKIENIPATFSKIMPDGKLCGHDIVPSLPSMPAMPKMPSLPSSTEITEKVTDAANDAAATVEARVGRVCKGFTWPDPITGKCPVAAQKDTDKPIEKGTPSNTDKPIETIKRGGKRRRRKKRRKTRRKPRRRRKTRRRRRRRKRRTRKRRKTRRKTRRGGGGGRMWKIGNRVEARRSMEGAWEIGTVMSDDITHNNIKFADGTVYTIANSNIRPPPPPPPRPKLRRNRRRHHY